MLRTLARGDPKHQSVITGDVGRHIDPTAVIRSIILPSGATVDPPRTLTHPSFSAVDGDGILTYRDPVTLDTINPDIVRNFILGPARGVETQAQKTLGGTALIKHLQKDEDVFITEQWTGGAKLSVLASLFRKLYEFWITIPDPGKFLIWAPADLTTETFGVQIFDLKLPNEDFNYREYREDPTTRAGAYLAETVSIVYKVVGEDVAPKGSITLTGF